MSSLAKEIIELKDEIEGLKIKQAKYEGIISILYDRLKKEFDCSNEKQAKKLENELELKVKRLNDDVQNSIANFREKYGI